MIANNAMSKDMDQDHKHRERLVKGVCRAKRMDAATQKVAVAKGASLTSGHKISRGSILRLGVAVGRYSTQVVCTHHDAQMRASIQESAITLAASAKKLRNLTLIRSRTRTLTKQKKSSRQGREVVRGSI